MSFPLPLADFWDRLDIGPSPEWALTDNRTQTRGAGGQLTIATRGPRLWTASPNILPARHVEGNRISALIDLAQRGGFLAYPNYRQYPANDPDGTILGASTPTVIGLPADAHEIRIIGLPVGYVLRAGDFLSVLRTGPARSLHRVITDTVTADGDGNSGIFAIEPARPSGIIVGDAVTLVRPTASFVIEAGGRNSASVPQVVITGAGFAMTERP